MSRTLAVLAAIALAAPASAATYAGKPAAPTTHNRIVGRDIVWSLAGDQYQGTTDGSRPVVLCQSLAKRAGRLESFTVDGRAIGEADLAKCNAAAPGGNANGVAEAN